jgi:hypothetical protein
MLNLNFLEDREANAEPHEFTGVEHGPPKSGDAIRGETRAQLALKTLHSFVSPAL